MQKPKQIRHCNAPPLALREVNGRGGGGGWGNPATAEEIAESKLTAAEETMGDWPNWPEPKRPNCEEPIWAQNGGAYIVNIFQTRRITSCSCGQGLGNFLEGVQMLVRLHVNGQIALCCGRVFAQFASATELLALIKYIYNIFIWHFFGPTCMAYIRMNMSRLVPTLDVPDSPHKRHK